MSDKNIEKMGKIVRAIVNTGCLDEINWAEFSCIFSFDVKARLVSTTGYAYDLQGEWTAFSVKPRLIREDVGTYEKFLRKAGDTPMKQMLFQFNRDTNHVHVDFEYDDSTRWKVSPSNLETIIQEIKPNLG